MSMPVAKRSHFLSCICISLSVLCSTGSNPGMDSIFQRCKIPSELYTSQFINQFYSTLGSKPRTRFTISVPISYHNSPRVFHYTHDSPFTTCAQDISRFISDGSSINFLTSDVSLPLFPKRFFIDKPSSFYM